MEHCINDAWREAAAVFSQWAVVVSVLICAGVYKFEAAREWWIGEE